LDSKSAPTLIISSSTFSDRIDQILQKKVYDQHICSGWFSKHSIEKGAKLERVEVIGSLYASVADAQILTPIELYMT
jgi:hypothetical protein